LFVRSRNINLNERFYDTGFIKDARKTTMKTGKSLIFFLPKRFIPYIEKYILFIGKNQEWLFPGRSKHYTYNAFYGYVKRNYGKKFCNFHKFRSTLISNRLYKEKCPLWISEGLTNHKISESTQIKHYAKFKLEQKRNLYDDYFPYDSFPYF